MSNHQLPESWDDASQNGPDHMSVLNANANEFVPGYNVFARVFVPQTADSNVAEERSECTRDVINECQQESVCGKMENLDLSEEMSVTPTDVPSAHTDKVDYEPGELSAAAPVSYDWESGSGGGDTPMDEEEEEEEEVHMPVKQMSQGEIKKTHLNVVFIGHVDAGKSTIGGHIMYLTGMVDKRTLEKYEREAKEKNRESWYLSWALDTNLEERDKGKTVETGRAFFETETKHFTILDAPGHRGFVPNMITGASQADVAVLVISARKGEFETGFDRGGQTREHAMLAKTAGVRKLIIVVNKMDDPTVEWDEARFVEVQDKLTPFLKKCGFNPKTDIIYIPVSGLLGTNLKSVDTTACTWYTGPSLIGYLDSLPAFNRLSEGPIRLPIAGKYKDMGTIVLGKMESGTLRKGQNVTLMPNRIGVEVIGLWSDDLEADEVLAGENVKVKLKNVEEEDVSSGFVLCSSDNLCHTGKVFDAQVVILEHDSIICAGYSAVMHMFTIEEEFTITHLICLIDKKTNEKSKTRPKFLKQDQIAIVRMEVLNGVICMETFKDFQVMGRFTIRDKARTVGIGKVLKVIA